MTPPVRTLSRALLAGVVLFAAGTARADMARRALPPPAPKPVHTAGALFVEDFSKGLERWAPDREGVWSLRAGMLRADLPDRKQERSLIHAGDSTWTDYAVDLDVCMMRGVDKGVVIRVEGENGVAVDLRGPGYQDVLLQRREWPLGRATTANANAVWHHLRIEARGSSFKVWVNGDFKLERRNVKGAPERGGIALPAYTGGVGECTVYYDNVVVSPLAPEPPPKPRK